MIKNLSAYKPADDSIQPKSRVFAAYLKFAEEALAEERKARGAADLKEMSDMPMPKDFCHAAYELADDGYRREVERAARLMRAAAKSEEAADARA